LVFVLTIIISYQYLDQGIDNLFSSPRVWSWCWEKSWSWCWWR